MRSPNFTPWQQKEGGASIREQDDESRRVDHGEDRLPFHFMGGGANFIPSSYVDSVFLCGY